MLGMMMDLYPWSVSAFSRPVEKGYPMPTITTADGTTIFYKDWGAGQPIVFSHGWPLSSDDWDADDLLPGSGLTGRCP